MRVYLVYFIIPMIQDRPSGYQGGHFYICVFKDIEVFRKGLQDYNTEEGLSRIF